MRYCITELPPIRQCRRCSDFKSIVDFSKKTTCFGGVSHICLICYRKQLVEYRSRDRKRWSEYEKSRLIKDPELAGRKLKQKRDYHKAHPERALYNTSKSRSKKLNLDHNVTKEYIRSIWPQNNRCPVFNIELKIGGIFSQDSPTMDRIDNSKGYIIGNVAIISHRANILKRNATLKELLLLVNWLKNSLP